jgi:hypothetical protein
MTENVDEYCIVESLRDYELLSSQLNDYKDKESSAETERRRLEERNRLLVAENSRLRVQAGQQRLHMQELEEELETTPVEEEVRLELSCQRRYAKTLEAALDAARVAAQPPAPPAPPAPPPPPPPPAPAPPPPPPAMTHLASPGIWSMGSNRVLYADPKRWKSA